MSGKCNFVWLYHFEHLPIDPIFRIYLSKQWTELAVFNDHTATATGVCFGESASFLTSVSLDRSLKIFSL